MVAKGPIPPEHEKTRGVKLPCSIPGYAPHTFTPSQVLPIYNIEAVM